jgi:plastocyanin
MRSSEPMNLSRKDHRRMRTAISVVVSCGALTLASGCGSSGASSSSASSPTTGTTAHSSGLKVNTAPKYASPSASAPVQSGVVQIAYRNITIAPDTLKVKVGSTIRWTNYDAIEHNVTSRGGPAHFASGNFGEGKTFEVKLTAPGVIHYLCTNHPTSMNGTIEVIG